MAMETVLWGIRSGRPAAAERYPESVLTEAEMSEQQTGSGVQLVSDGSAENTQLLVDGHPVRGVTEITWRFSKAKRRATMIVELHDVSVDSSVELPDDVLEALRTIQNYELGNL